MVAVLAAGEALAGGVGHPAVGGHWVAGSGLGRGLGQHWAGGRHGAYVGYGRWGHVHRGYWGGGYWGGYYGGGGIYYDDAGYYDNYTPDHPVAYSAATIPAPTYYYPPQVYEQRYLVPAILYSPAVDIGDAPVVSYGSYQHIIYLPAAHHRLARRHCDCSAD
jgi:hypothetical protein